VPMHTPAEAIEELDHAVSLGYKVIAIPSWVSRPVAAAARELPGSETAIRWLDTYGIDSEYDYDPFWQRCVDHKVAIGAHSQGFGSPFGTRRSISSYLYNHMGHFADCGEAICKSLFLGGVTARFPSLRFAILEGGVGWAVRLFGDLLSHWDKRNAAALENYNPANLDREQLSQFLMTYGVAQLQDRDPEQVLDALMPASSMGGHAGPTDEWARSQVTGPDDIASWFPRSFTFGCEADDRLVFLAFRARELFGAPLQAVFSSDMGHWDVPDMMEILDEAFEQTEDGLLTADEFEQFTYTNAVRLYAHNNRHFFDGTVIEAAAAKTLGATERA
jgi:predicted TIM-barrel fold metal-dependent hydrolase